MFYFTWATQIQAVYTPTETEKCSTRRGKRPDSLDLRSTDVLTRRAGSTAGTQSAAKWEVGTANACFQPGSSETHYHQNLDTEKSI